MKSNNIILLGFHAGTTPVKNPIVLTDISSTLKKRGFETVYWTMDDVKENLHIKYRINDLVLAGTEETLLTEDEKNKWIERCINRGQKREDAVNTIRIVERYSIFIFKTIQPSIFIGWNNLTFSFGVFADIAQKMGVKVYNIEAGALLNSWRFEEINFAQKFKYPTFEQKYASIGKQLLDQSPLQNSSIYKQNSLHEEEEIIQSKKKEGKRIVLVLGTLEGDAGATIGGKEKELILPEFDDSYAVAAKCAAINNDFIIFKPHPLSTVNFKEHNLYTENVYIFKSNPLILIELSDIVVNNFGKLTIALLQSCKKTINIGIGFFYGLEVGKMVYSESELLNLLTNDFDYDSEKYYKNFEFAIGYLYATRWYLFPNSGIEIPSECLNTDNFVDFLLRELDTSQREQYNLKPIVDLINNCSSKTLNPQIVIQQNNSIKKAFKLILNVNAWKILLSKKFKR